MKARHKRLILVGLAVAGVGVAATLALKALQSNIAYFFSPSQVLANEAPRDRTIRVGGLVEKGSLERKADGLSMDFRVTDNKQTVTVRYTGILPDLFSEGRGVVTRGRLGADNLFVAEEVLAKHDEAYMPPEVAASLQTTHAEGVAQTSAGSKP